MQPLKKDESIIINYAQKDNCLVLYFSTFSAHANTAFHVTNVTFKQANHHIYGADLSMEGGRETEICVRFSEATRSWRVRLMS